jgi:hypothetical protein
MTSFLRLRHRLIPYLYTMNWRSHTQGETPVMPMYYVYPRCEEAYQVPTQYFFGSELIVCPITEPMDRTLMRAGVMAWLPEGLYFDLFNGLMYHGGRRTGLFRPLEEIPVLARAGAILPMAAREDCPPNGAPLPISMDIHVYAGADGSFEMVEDDGETMAYLKGERYITAFSLRWRAGEGTEFAKLQCEAKEFMPHLRTYTVSFIGVEANDSLAVFMCDGEPVKEQSVYDTESHTLRVTLCDIPCGTGVNLIFEKPLLLAANETAKRFERILAGAQMEYELKDKIYRLLTGGFDERQIISSLHSLRLPHNVMGAILEVLLA